MTSWHRGNFLGAWALFWLVAHIRKHLQRLMKPSSSHCFYYRCLQVVYDASSLLSINRDSITDDIICVFSRQVQYLVWDCEKEGDFVGISVKLELSAALVTYASCWGFTEILQNCTFWKWKKPTIWRDFIITDWTKTEKSSHSITSE